MTASPVPAIRRAHQAARTATRAATALELLPLPPNAEELRVIVDSIPLRDLPFRGAAKAQWRGVVRWLAWELARRGVQAPPFRP